jgi:hypothetical protein
MNYRDCRALPFLSRCIMRREGGREEEVRRTGRGGKEEGKMR